MTNGLAREALVWDLPVRIVHWALVACVTGSWLTHQAGVEWFGWHRRFGYASLVLVLFRIAWGFAGTRHARFASFVRTPGAVVAYLKSGARPSAGHNPLGALGVIALLGLLLLQGATGLYANDEIASAGPFYGWVSHETSNRLSALHQANSTWLLAAIALHVLAVGWHVLLRREALLRTMFTGRKDARLVQPGEEIGESRLLLAAVICAAIGAALAIAIGLAPDAAVALF